jgi:uncharacterized protein YbjT (DUF2867 family)
MRFFVTGASGYIGGSVAQKLRASGHEVLGLVRSEEKARLLKDRGVTPILGTLDEAAILTDGARQADAVINAASTDDQGVVETLVAASRVSAVNARRLGWAPKGPSLAEVVEGQL